MVTASSCLGKKGKPFRTPKILKLMKFDAHPPVWAREIGTIYPFGVFFPVLYHFLAQFGANPCSEERLWRCDVLPCLKAFQVVLWYGSPEFAICPFGPEHGLFRLPKHYVFKGKWPIFEAKNAIKQGKNAKRTNGTHFPRVPQPPPLIWLRSSNPTFRFLSPLPISV